MFMVGGIAALTLIVNAPSSGFVLKLLGMMDEDKDLKKELQANLKVGRIKGCQYELTPYPVLTPFRTPYPLLTPFRTLLSFTTRRLA
jgi:hypothetical protein